MKLDVSPPLQAGHYYVLDGGFSTQLSRYVAGVDADPLWTARSLVTRKQEVARVHRDFLAAGARIVITCSYQVSNQLFQDELGLSRAETREHLGTQPSLDDIELLNKESASFMDCDRGCGCSGQCPAGVARRGGGGRGAGPHAGGRLRGSVRSLSARRQRVYREVAILRSLKRQVKLKC